MLLKSKITRLVFSLCLCFSLAAIAFADTIRLKDGSIIKGKIINFTGGQFTVLIGDGARQRRMNFYADEVESIEFDGSTLGASNSSVPTQLPSKSNSSTNNQPKTNNGDTIITVGQTNNNPSTTNPQQNTETKQNSTVIPVNTNTTSNPTTQNPSYTNQLPKPVALNVKVLADNTANGWTNSGWVVKKGQRIRISGKGSVSLGGGNYSTPNGLGSLADQGKLMPKEATGGLIAVIGDDNNDFIFIGGSKEFVAARDGALFLGVNEANLDDNSGAFEVSVEIMP